MVDLETLVKESRSQSKFGWTETDTKYANFFLIPGATWPEEYDLDTKLKELTAPHSGEVVKNTIRTLRYRDFLKTPYWTAIAEYVIAKSGRCAICGYERCDLQPGNKLTVHHNDWTYHGKELVLPRLALKSLVCVCEDCHAVLHSHLGSKFCGRYQELDQLIESYQKENM